MQEILNQLKELSYNLSWTWNNEFYSVFEEINKMTKRMKLNVILNCNFLQKKNRKKLVEVKKNLDGFYRKQKLNEFFKKSIKKAKFFVAAHELMVYMHK